MPPTSSARPISPPMLAKTIPITRLAVQFDRGRSGLAPVFEGDGCSRLSVIGPSLTWRENSTLLHGRLRAQGAGSGAPIERPMWLAITWRGTQDTTYNECHSIRHVAVMVRWIRIAVVRARGTLVAVLAALLPALFASAATAKLVADYRFDGNLRSSVEGASDAFASGANLAFETEDVAGCNRQVLTFPVDQGVAIHTKDVIGSGSYTMIMQARFETVPPDDYVRAINWFPSFTVDNGLYLYQGKLVFYDNNASLANHQGSADVPPNRYVELAVSRDAASKLVTGYVNGAPQFTYTEAFDQAVSPHPAG